MSGETHEPGSILEFTPETKSGLFVKAWRGQWMGEVVDAFRVWGWARFVTKRDSWVIATEVQPAIWCCNAIRPVKWHMDEKDHGYSGDIGEEPWEFELEESDDA